eukprot:SAG11_NODE_105_length_16528_cov_4.337635_2_plen_111_part_00
MVTLHSASTKFSTLVLVLVEVHYRFPITSPVVLVCIIKLNREVELFLLTGRLPKHCKWRCALAMSSRYVVAQQTVETNGTAKHSSTGSQSHITACHSGFFGIEPSKISKT